MTAYTFEREEELVLRVQHGDDGAFDRLVELCAPRVYNLAYRLVGHPDDAQDIAQEAFLRIYQAIPRFKGESAFSTWLYRIVTNACYDELKRRRRRPAPLSDLELPDTDTAPVHEATTGESAQDEVERRERSQAVQRAIAEIPENFRVVLVLFDLQGFSYDEIAGILQLNVGTVKSRLNRARNLLREKLRLQRELFDLRDSQSK